MNPASSTNPTARQKLPGSEHPAPPRFSVPAARLLRTPFIYALHCHLLWATLSALAFQTLAAEKKVNAPANPAALSPVTDPHWALKPVTRPAVPANPDPNWSPRNPVDYFVFARLAQAQLSPSPPAEPRTLVRRLYFDLLGLPPTPEEVTAFVQDSAPDAYERLVERLLASPHYGERWARHWLDVVRFAESHGCEMNQPRPNAWPYRDYVIRAFNQDKPYDHFILEQFAGDVLGEDAATGFLVGGAWDQVKSPDVVLTSMQRADELHDVISTTGSAFLGLTVGCARCHDHKFDPVPQTNYYSLKACLAGLHHGERKLRTPDNANHEAESRLCRETIARLETQLTRFEPLASTSAPASTNRFRAPVNARQNVERFADVPAKRLRFTIRRTTGGEPCIDELEVYTASPKPENIALASRGTRASASSVYPNSEIHRIPHLNDGKVGNSHSWISNESGRGWVELEFPETVLINRVVWGRDRDQQFSDRLALEYQLEVGTTTNDWRLVASSIDRQPYSPEGSSDPAPAVAGLSPQDAAQVKQLMAERAAAERRLKDLTATPMVYAGVFTDNPEPTHRLHRGDPMQEREVVEPGVINAIPLEFPLRATNGLPVPSSSNSQDPHAASQKITEDQSRRLALAKWIANPANPLPARVMVNRLWLYHFGEGIVSTPSDFGANGGKPTHPDLLDWLAAEFVHPTTPTASSSPVTPPWSIKHLQRLIVTSATYRQASAARPEGQRVDAASRLLWRFPPKRLEAEPLRDTILAITASLDLRAGGPGFSPFEPNDNYVRVYNPKKQFGPPEWRRMIYMTKFRMQQDATFGAFDCPDGGQVTPKRMRSTTPLQALNLLNSEFIMQQSALFSSRLERETGADVPAQIRRAFELAFSRLPDPEELNTSQTLVARHGLTTFCRAVFNSNEFVFVE